jgi:hypothetical protein
MEKRWLAIVTIMVLGVAGAAPVCATNTPLTPTFVTPFLPQGGFGVQAMVDGVWQRVGDLPCDRYIRERTLTLPDGALGARHVRVRLVEHGGGAAHIDSVLLGSTPPIRVDGAPEGDALSLIARRDNDLLDVFGRTIELTFPAGCGSVRSAVRTRRRRCQRGSPLAFCPRNTFQPLTPVSAFYHYLPATVGRCHRPDASIGPGRFSPSTAGQRPAPMV